MAIVVFSSSFCPDVLIGLTALAYRLEGLRLSDVRKLVQGLRAQLQMEIGPEAQRPAACLFASWIQATDTAVGAKIAPLARFQVSAFCSFSSLCASDCYLFETGVGPGPAADTI